MRASHTFGCLVCVCVCVSVSIVWLCGIWEKKHTKPEWMLTTDVCRSKFIAVKCNARARGNKKTRQKQPHLSNRAIHSLNASYINYAIWKIIKWVSNKNNLDTIHSPLANRTRECWRFCAAIRPITNEMNCLKNAENGGKFCGLLL